MNALVMRTPIVDEASWLAARQPNINASEVAALFGCHAQETMLSLYARKSGLAELPAPSGAILERGHILEPAVAEFVRRQRPDWRLEKNTDYLHSPKWRMGATIDYWAWCPRRGPGVLQCKAVAMPEYKEKWEDGAPMGFVLQTVQEALLAGEAGMSEGNASPVSWGALGVLAVSSYGYDGAVHEFDRDPAAEMRLINGVAEFWSAIAEGRQPVPDYARDDEVIKALYPRDDGETLDLSSDNRLAHLLDERERLAAEIATAKPAIEQLEAVNAEIRAKLGSASAARLRGWEITNRLQHRKATEATSFRVLRVKRLKREGLAA